MRVSCVRVVYITTDMNNDGAPDLIVCGTATTWVLISDGLSPPSFTRVTYNSFSTLRCAVADMNNDGALDILTATSSSVGWMKSNGAAIPSFAASSTVNVSVSGIASPATFGPSGGDCNGDGYTDMIATWGSGSLASGSVYYYQSDGKATPTWSAALVQGSVDCPQNSDLADFDGDGDLDALTGMFYTCVLSSLVVKSVGQKCQYWPPTSLPGLRRSCC